MADKPKRRTVDDVFRDMYGKELAAQVEALKNKNAIGTAESERREREAAARRQRELDAEALRQAEEDEARRFPDK